MIKRVSAFLASFALVAAALVGLGASPAQAASTYYYAGVGQDLTATQEASATGFYVNMTMHQATTNPFDHSLGEIAVQTDNGSGQPSRTAVVEAGYYNFNGSTGGPKAFVSAWVNNTWGGSYTGTGDGFFKCNKSGTINCGSFANLNAGDTLVDGSAYRVRIVHSTISGSSGWWIEFTPIVSGVATCPSGKTCYLGYYDDSVFTSPSSPYSGSPVTFTGPKYVNAFGEVTNDDSVDGTVGTCSNMGSATGSGTASNPTTTVGASMGSAVIEGLPTTAVDLSGLSVTNSSWYNAIKLGTTGNIRSMRYGGGGSC